MEESNACDPVPDLKDLELKVGRKTPEGLLKWMREDHKTVVFHQIDNNESEGKKGLDEKIRKLRLEMAHLRAADVKILNQLLALHEGIESVKWLLEERGTLTSHCSSLTSSQFSLVDGPDTSWRGSWSSLQDPHDKLDNISIGSYLDTLADDLDEYCPSSGADSIICANAEVSRAAGGGMSSFTGSSQVKQEVPTEDTALWNKVASDSGRPSRQNIPNGVLKDSPGACLAEKLGKNQSPKAKHYKTGIELDSCKMNGKVQAEFDAHWHWVQSQDDVTFL